jgi:hypothetical protein
MLLVLQVLVVCQWGHQELMHNRMGAMTTAVALSQLLSSLQLRSQHLPHQQHTAALQPQLAY